MEAALVRQHGVEFEGVSFRRDPRQGLEDAAARSPSALLQGLLAEPADRIPARRAPDVVLGLGGSRVVPRRALAGVATAKPLVLHDARCGPRDSRTACSRTAPTGSCSDFRTRCRAGTRRRCSGSAIRCAMRSSGLPLPQARCRRARGGRSTWPSWVGASARRERSNRRRSGGDGDDSAAGGDAAARRAPGGQRSTSRRCRPRTRTRKAVAAVCIAFIGRHRGALRRGGTSCCVAAAQSPCRSSPRSAWRVGESCRSPAIADGAASANAQFLASTATAVRIPQPELTPRRWRSGCSRPRARRCLAMAIAAAQARPAGRRGPRRRRLRSARSDAMKHKVKRVHFVGIGGAGMSGIAEVLATQGYQVSGSDLAASKVTARLAKLGIAVAIGHAPANVAAPTRSSCRQRSRRRQSGGRRAREKGYRSCRAR